MYTAKVYTVSIPSSGVALEGEHVDVAKLEAAIKTTLPIILFFKKFHDSGNTIQTELDRVQDIRVKFQGRCTCIDYYDHRDFADALTGMLQGYTNILKH